MKQQIPYYGKPVSELLQKHIHGISPWGKTVQHQCLIQKCPDKGQNQSAPVEPEIHHAKTPAENPKYTFNFD